MVRPDFLNEDDFGWGADGCLKCYFPHPNIDGRNPGATGYSMTLRKDHIVIRQYTNFKIESDQWPFVLCLPGTALPDEFTISIRRVSDSGSSAEMVLSSPAKPKSVVASDVSTLDRWLLHIPKRSGNFAGLLKLVNRQSEESTSFKLHGFDSAGKLVASATLTLQAEEAKYETIYDGVFSGRTDLISHIAIEDSANMVEVFLGYRQMDSGFTVWQKEISLKQAGSVGRVFGLETSGSANSADGVAVLNLRENHAVSVLAASYDNDGVKLQERALGTLVAGGKAVYVLSSLFNDPNATSYSLSTTEDELIQVIGFAFSGPLFAPAITNVIN